jgi:hypothetical protein
VSRRDDDAHPADAEHTLDAQLSRDELARERDASEIIVVVCRRPGASGRVVRHESQNRLSAAARGKFD